MEIASGDKRDPLDETKEFVSAAAQRASVYLCYKSEDRGKAAKVCQLFEQRGMACWFAARDQKPSQPWPDCLDEAIESSRFFLLFLTPYAAKSPDLIPELTKALAAGRSIVVLSIGEDEIIPELEKPLLNAHWFKVGEKASYQDIENLWRLLVELETGAVVEDDGIVEIQPGLVNPVNASGILVHLSTIAGRITGKTTYRLGERERLLLGRGPAVDIDVEDTRVSRRHAGLAVKRDPVHGLYLSVVDLMSTNGTWVRYFRDGDSEFSKFVENGEARVTSGAVIRLGSTDIRVTSAHVPSNLIHLSSRTS
jgi:hypothetical protein